MSDLEDWLAQIGAAAQEDKALGGVPLGISARLTQLGFVKWIGQNSVTLSLEGRLALSGLHVIE